MKTKFVIIIAAALAVSFVAGYYFGFGSGFTQCVNLGLKFVKSQNISVGIDEELFRQGVYRYKNNIGEITHTPLALD